MTTWGSTENGDPAFDSSWLNKLCDVNLIITKNLSDWMIDRLIENKARCILHLTVTGLGGSFIEPGVPTVDYNARQLKKLFEHGFPCTQTVLRIDPMISAYLAKHILDAFCDTGVTRVKFSFLNLTNYTSNSLSDAEINRCIEDATELIDYSHAKNYQYTFESCAGAWLKHKDIQLRGCMNEKEAGSLGLKDVRFEHGKRNRNFCLAPLNRVELLEGHKCLHNCKYCFLKDKREYSESFARRYIWANDGPNGNPEQNMGC